jgi:hypothetical protein
VPGKLDLSPQVGERFRSERAGVATVAVLAALEETLEFPGFAQGRQLAVLESWRPLKRLAALAASQRLAFGWRPLRPDRPRQPVGVSLESPPG